MAAKRLTENLKRKPQAGGLFRAIDGEATELQSKGDRTSDIFALRLALELAKINYQRVKKKSALATAALYTLGMCHRKLAGRSTNERHLFKAQDAFKLAFQKTPKTKDAMSWAIIQFELGNVLMEMGERAADPELLRRSVQTHRDVLKVQSALSSIFVKNSWHNLGTALNSLGTITRDSGILSEAVDSFKIALSLEDLNADAVSWGETRNGLALAERHLGDVTEDLSILENARKGYAASLALDLKDEYPFLWAVLQWNLADLALVRHRLAPDPANLTEARDHVAKARAFFVDGSDYQTQRCDELLDQINAAELA